MKKSYVLKYALMLIIGAFFIHSPVQAKKSSQDSSGKKESGQNFRSQGVLQESFSDTQLKTHSVGIALGQTFLLGDFDDNGSDGLFPEIYYTYTASYSFDLIANFHYTKHDYQSRQVLLPGFTLGIKGRVFQFDNFSPFLHGGLGFYRPKVTREINNQMVDSQGKVTLGTQLGAGLDLRLNRNFVVGIISHYHNPFDVKQDFATEVEGSYFKLLLTSLYNF